MLTDLDLTDLCKKMKIPLERICFKSELDEEPLVYNKSYIINLSDEVDDETGERSEGSHWVAFQVNKTPKGQIQPIYFDSYGIGPPEDVKKFIGVTSVPFGERDIQGLYDSFCGWACCAFLHFINSAPTRSGDLYSDTEHFLAMFIDLNKEQDMGQNDWVLRQFFKAPKIKTNF